MLRFPPGANKLRTLLVLGAHCDDIEIGCGGAVLRLAEHYPDMRVHWVVFSSSEVRAAEARRSAELFLADVHNRQIEVLEFRTSYFPFEGAEIKEYFEELKTRVSPDLVLTHARLDSHQDHRLIAELTWNTFRDHFILEYEIPKYDGDMGAPNFFVPLDAQHYSTKVDHLLASFKSQRSKAWFDRETFLGLMRLRGMECNSSSGYAEAFYCRKAVMEPLAAHPQ
jgi:LmbE family N-acetylglucosaminyl deacetylase